MLLALQRLLVAMGAGAGAADAFVLPVLRYACDPGGPEALNLLEDGLATWLTALRVAPAANPQLTDLFPLLAAAMHASTGGPPCLRLARRAHPGLVGQLPLATWRPERPAPQCSYSVLGQCCTTTKKSMSVVSGSTLCHNG